MAGRFDKYVLYVEGGAEDTEFYIKEFTCAEKVNTFGQAGLPSLKELYADQFDFGTAVTGNEVLDGLISKYLNTGSTGNKALDKIIENFINGGHVDAELANLIQKFFNDGTTGNKAMDSLVEKYLTEGSAGNKALDKVILNYINAGHLDAQLMTLLKNYLKKVLKNNI